MASPSARGAGSSCTPSPPTPEPGGTAVAGDAPAVGVSWTPPAPVDVSDVRALEAWVGLPRPLSELLVRRGFEPDAAVRRFLRPGFSDLHPPAALSGMGAAVDRIERAIRDGEAILVHGDYDVDGMTGAALLTLAIRDLGGRVVPFVPHRRRDGYDLGEAGLATAIAAGAGLIVTADCGVAAVSAVAQAVGRGVDVIVTDHHRPGPELPAAYAVINPGLADQAYPFRGLAGVGVAFKLVHELFEKQRVDSGRLNQYLDLVALGTIADQAPLIDENRSLVRFGLRVLDRSRRPGVRALCREASVGRWSEVRASDVAFRLAPRLNSAGRIADAADGLRLLVTDDDAEADDLARKIDRLNDVRKDADRQLLAEARERFGVDFDPERDGALVLWGDEWHPGVLGIVASRLAEEVNRPAVLIGLDGDLGRGSARSVPGFNLFAALEGCGDLFERFGGHAAAAGFDIRRDRLERFRARFAEIVTEARGAVPPAPTLEIDGELSVGEVTPEVSRGMRYLQPFGNGNPTPRFIAPAVHLRNVEAVGQDGAHARMRLEDGSGELEAIAFWQPDLAGRLDDRPRDVVYELHVERRPRGLRTQAHVIDIAGVPSPD